jgi:hypothetical protein
MLVADGQPLPPEAIEPPRVPMQEFFREAYWNLHTERSFNGWELPPIPESKIYAYARRKGLRHRTAEAVTYVIRQMDGVHREWVRDEQAEAAARNNKK